LYSVNNVVIYLKCKVLYENKQEGVYKISSAGAAGLAITGSALKLFAGKDKELEKLLKSGEVKRYPTYCEICFWKCADGLMSTKKEKSGKLLVMKKTHIATEGFAREEQAE
jgi:hypothetical protein